MAKEHNSHLEREHSIRAIKMTIEADARQHRRNNVCYGRN